MKASSTPLGSSKYMLTGIKTPSLLTTSLPLCPPQDGPAEKEKPVHKSLYLTFKGIKVPTQAAKGKQNCAGLAAQWSAVDPHGTLPSLVLPRRRSVVS